MVQHRAREAIWAAQRRAGRPSGRALRLTRIAWSMQRSSAPARSPAEETDREEETDHAPDRDHHEVIPGDGGAVAGNVGVEESLEEWSDREVIGEVDDPGGQLIIGNEDTGEEVERQQQGVDDRCGCVLRGDRGGEGNAEATE